jgi:hypothetical protein
VLVLVGGGPSTVVVIIVTITPGIMVSEHEVAVMVAWGDWAL